MAKPEVLPIATTPSSDSDHHGSPMKSTGEQAFRGILCFWEYHSLPEYMESDTTLSLELLQSYAIVLEALNIHDCELKICDAYPEDPPDDPHYLLYAKFGNPQGELDQLTYVFEYDSKDVDLPSSGTIKIIVGVPIRHKADLYDLAIEATMQYDLAIVKFYPKPSLDYKGKKYLAGSSENHE